jgi:hypothetical protein
MPLIQAVNGTSLPATIRDALNERVLAPFVLDNARALSISGKSARRLEWPS